MRRFLFLFLGFLAFAVSSANLRAGSHDGGNVSVSTEGGHGAIDDCGQIHVAFDGEPAARSEVSLESPAVRDPLSIHVPENSGVYVVGGDRRDISIQACKAAVSGEDLSRISVSLGRDGTLSLDGPSGRRWLVYLIVHAPAGTAVDLSAVNGPVSVRGLSGEVAARTQNGPLSFSDLTGHAVARAENGPISVARCSGDVDAEAENGPISLRAGSGRQKLVTQNGPISVTLAGTTWQGAGLEAHATNGPLSLAIPENYRTGTRVESAGRSSFHCRLAACTGSRRSWDDDSRSIEFGDSQMLVHLSTVNGPVSINSQESDE